jgi:hypothetical protein
MNAVNPGYMDTVSVISDVRYNRVKGSSRKYTTGYLANTRNKHGSTCDYINGFYTGVLLF